MRVFQKEGTANSIFMRNSNASQRTEDEIDTRMKLRIGFNSVNTIHRQLLITEDERASEGFDWGFDGLRNESQMDDMYWMIDNDQYIIQGIDRIDEYTVLPVGMHTNEEGLNSITIDALENAPADLEIYAHDKALGIYHDLKESDYSIYLPAGEYHDRFEITFTSNSLSVEETEIADTLLVYYSNTNNGIVIHNPKLTDIKSVELVNMLGQSVNKFQNIESTEIIRLKTNQVSTGTYIINLKLDDGTILTKKVLVK